MRLLILFIILTCPVHSALREDELSKKSKGVRLSPNEIKKIEQMHYGWYVQAVSGLLGAMGKELYMKMNRKNRKAFIACLDSIDTEHDIKNGAKCLVKAFDGQLISSFPGAIFSPQYDFVGKEMPETKFTLRNSPKKLKFKIKMKKFLKKKAIKELLRQNKLKLKLPRFKKPVRLTMSQERRESKQWYRRRIRRNILSLYTNDEAKKEAKRIDKMDSPWKVRVANRAPSLIDTPTHKTPIKTITDLLGGVVRLVKNQTVGEQKTLHQSYAKLTELQEIVSSKNRDSQFKHRMLDMVLGKNHPLRKKKTFTERFQDIVPKGLVDKSVYGLVDTVAKHTKDVNYNLLSPRFFPLLPDKYSNKKPILSPNLFPMYKDDSENSILPIPELLEKSGMRKQDRTNVLELIMDASGLWEDLLRDFLGVNEVVDDALRIVKNLGATGLGKDIMDITNALDGAFMDLQKSFTRRQKRDLSSRKYTFMSKDQLDQLYGTNGIYNNTITKFPFDINEYSNMTHREKYESLKETVRLLAEEKPRRRKRTIEIRVFKHTTLAPYGFSPTVMAFSVLGPTVLSPNIFSPSVIGPLLLSPPIISPQVGDPLVLSPYFLGPNTISAAVFNAYILSPYVLSPNVVNPYVLSPLILSPYVLCPDVLSPTILSGAILSPSVASPAVFTESALAAAVLSPSIFS